VSVRLEFLVATLAQVPTRSVAVNVRGTFLSYKEAAKQMIKQGKGGCIIGMSRLFA
jgi:NAD(P)-dependent dehydrogenase (short-subunit alcohol dehydrogenase family)